MLDNMSMKSLILFLISYIIGVAYTFGAKVYSIEHEYQADIKVFVVDAEYKADLKVFLQTKNTALVGKRMTRNLFFIDYGNM